MWANLIARQTTGRNRRAPGAACTLSIEIDQEISDKLAEMAPRGSRSKFLRQLIEDEHERRKREE